MKFQKEKRRDKVCSRSWNNNNGIQHHLLWPLERSDKTFWNSPELNMALVNIQSLKPKLDMLIHHIQFNSICHGNMDTIWK